MCKFFTFVSDDMLGRLRMLSFYLRESVKRVRVVANSACYFRHVCPYVRVSVRLSALT